MENNSIYEFNKMFKSHEFINLQDNLNLETLGSNNLSTIPND